MCPLTELTERSPDLWIQHFRPGSVLSRIQLASDDSYAAFAAPSCMNFDDRAPQICTFSSLVASAAYFRISQAFG